MAYVGTPLDTTNAFQSLAGKRFNGDASTTDFTLDSSPNSALDIEVFVGNVRQDPNSAYTVSGTTLAFTAAPPSGTNNIYVVHQAKSVGTIDVPVGSTLDLNGAAELILDADADTSITADTDDQIDIRVGGTDQITIKDGAVSPVTDNDVDLGTSSLEYKDGYFDGTLHCDVLDLAGTEHTSITSGITAASQWRLTSDLTGNAEPISSNLEEVDTSPYGTLGSSMTVSSGAFTFPSTGFWWIRFTGNLHQASSEDYMSIYIYSTLNNGSSWQAQALAHANTSGSATQSTSCDSLLDITDLSNQKVRFRVIQADTSNQLDGNSAYNKTSMTFIRLGDT